MVEKLTEARYLGGKHIERYRVEIASNFEDSLQLCYLVGDALKDIEILFADVSVFMLEEEEKMVADLNKVDSLVTMLHNNFNSIIEIFKEQANPQGDIIGEAEIVLKHRLETVQDLRDKSDSGVDWSTIKDGTGLRGRLKTLAELKHKIVDDVVANALFEGRWLLMHLVADITKAKRYSREINRPFDRLEETDHLSIAPNLVIASNQAFQTARLLQEVLSMLAKRFATVH